MSGVVSPFTGGRQVRNAVALTPGFDRFPRRHRARSPALRSPEPAWRSSAPRKLRSSNRVGNTKSRQPGRAHDIQRAPEDGGPTAEQRLPMHDPHCPSGRRPGRDGDLGTSARQLRDLVRPFFSAHAGSAPLSKSNAWKRAPVARASCALCTACLPIPTNGTTSLVKSKPAGPHSLWSCARICRTTAASPARTFR